MKAGDYSSYTPARSVQENEYLEARRMEHRRILYNRQVRVLSNPLSKEAMAAHRAACRRALEGRSA